jgi:hypothetical protein
MKLTFWKKSKAEAPKNKPEDSLVREKIADRLAKVKAGANDSCDAHDVNTLVEGLAEGDG